MKFAVFVAACSIAFPCAASAQTKPPISKAAEAYAQFLLAHHLEEREDENGAIAAYKRAMELDPQAADIPAELAALYLRQSKVQEAMGAAEQALKVAPANREANRVLGIIYAALAEGGRGGGGRGASCRQGVVRQPDQRRFAIWKRRSSGRCRRAIPTCVRRWRAST
jgi:tetratricopeptide (TPR) repeat protein